MRSDERLSLIDGDDRPHATARTVAQLINCAVLDDRDNAGSVQLVDAVQDDAAEHFVSPGVLYVARGSRSLRGADSQAVDERARSAVRAGASAILADHHVAGVADVAPLLVCNGEIDQIVGPAAAHIHAHPSEQLKTILVTGTDGKTTTCYLAAAALGAGLAGRVGLHTTVEKVVGGKSELAVLTTAEAVDLQRDLRHNVDAGDVGAVIETSSIAIVQGRVSAVDTDVAVFTNLSPDHLDLHGSMAQYFFAKAGLFVGAPCGAAVVNIDNPWGWLLADIIRLADEMPLHAVSPSGMAEGPGGLPVSVRPSELRRVPGGGADVSVLVRGDTGRMRVRLPGAHNVANALCALAAATAAGAHLDQALDGISAVERVPGRLDQIMNHQGVRAFVDYAHTPEALSVVLKECRVTAEQTGGRVIIVAGCGGDRDDAKRSAMGLACVEGADLVIATSDNPRNEDPDDILDQMLQAIPPDDSAKVIRLPDRRAAIKAAVDCCHYGDVLLVAGKGHERTQIVNEQHSYFDDHDELALALGSAWSPPNLRAGVRVDAS